MTKTEKAETIKQLEERFSKVGLVIFADYRGLRAAEMLPLRWKLRKQNIDFRVAKNTLLRIAAGNVGTKGLEKFLEGPTAVAFGDGEAAGTAKSVAEYIQSSRSVLRIKGGLMGKEILSAEQVAFLATLPPMNVLRARFLGQLKTPMARLVGVLNANIAGLVRVLDARAKQMSAG
jgi:large subunit ribosomal protein L10